MDEYETTEMSLDMLKDILKGDTYMSPSEYTYWKCREDRIFFVDYEFCDDYALIELAKVIICINEQDKDIAIDKRKPIQLWIHSYGGDANQNRGFRSVVQSSITPVITVAMGVCMSSGFDIFLAGTRRYVFEDSSLMCHAGYMTLSGTQGEVEDAQKNNKIFLDKDKKYILSRTNIPEAVYKKKAKIDWYLTSEEIEQYGVAKIVSSLSEIV